MPITIIVEDGTNVPDANSYVSVSDMRLFASNRGIDLTGLDDDSVAALLITSTDWVEGQEDDFVGKRTFTDQSLSWPRTKYSCTLGETLLAVPKGVVNAQCAAVLAAHSGVDLFPNVAGGQVPSEEVVGPIKVKYSRDSLYAGPSIPQADNYLKPFKRVSLGEFSVMRV